MSLNHAEQRVFDYLQKRPEERQYWQEKVRRAANGPAADLHAVAASLEGELWRYCEERSRVAPDFRSLAGPAGGGRISMRNLAEYLLRLWGPPKPRSSAAGRSPDGA
ncbi:MAG TPA: hypothetical protein VG838_11150 [Opitutaceae bacterium]|nr:hypothetical protein [Opitutaceae bacterium]